ncbi:MAG TPA: flippase activity-associated protein Agl23 [Pyrinomonadaceae bacterium]|nr:flippase activity-associated protein Agl23 [Pyrinomonadaceae bacterium]
MSTGSIKSSRNKPTIQRNARGEKEMPAATDAVDISQRSWLIGSISIMAVAALVRLYNLPLVPFHHDEGVNGNFLVHLVRDGVYRYDPENYHGPTLYYFSAIIPWVTRFLFGVSARDTYGLTTFNTRLITSLFGLGTIWLVLSLRRRLGAVASLAGAALLTLSPGAVYLSRYFIHESLFVFFTLGIVVAFVKYYDEGQAVYLVLGAASAGLLFATKETWIISVGVLLIAWPSTHIYRWLWRVSGFEEKGESPSQWMQRTVTRLGGPMQVAIAAFIAVAVCIVIAILFYSSFFTNGKGVSDSLKTFQIWTRTGREAHVHSARTYIDWLWAEEGTLLVLGALGAIATVFKPKNSMALFCALWAFGILAAYSLVPYKTPWLGLNFIVPLAIISGYAFQSLYEYAGSELSRPVVMVGVLALSICTYQMIVLNFVKYDNDAYIYVYAHTRRETLAMLDEIDKIAKRAGTGFDTGITITSPEYWPLPWYFRDYKRVGYYQRVALTTEAVIIASEGQKAEIQQTFGDRYRQVNSKFPLRPGVDLLLYVRKDLAGP